MIKKLFPPLSQASQTGYFFFLVVLIRLFFNAVIPLMDKTEARYAEIARLMAETGEWVVLQIDYGIPFWAKPPLSTWASALSIQLFGTAEFFVRLPYALVCIAMALFLGRYTSTKNQSFFLPGLILLCLPEFFLHVGVVSTDVFLAFSVAMVMLSFWEGMQKDSKSYWRYLFFVGMGLGLLAKGPIVGILTVPPLFLWCLMNKEARPRLFLFPWVLGSLLTLAIALPWYGLTEMKSPGFIDYFIIGEHFRRYLDSSWSGDKYGFPKQQPLGMIWLFLVGAILPYAFFFMQKVGVKFREMLSHPWLQFLLFWLLWTPLFFTSSKSLIHPYTLPVMVPVALIIVHFWEEVRHKNTLIYGGLAFPLLAVMIYFSGTIDGVFQANSDKSLVEAYAGKDLYAFKKKSYSSQFYSQGKIQVITAEELLGHYDSIPLLISKKDYKKIESPLKERLQGQVFSSKKEVYLYVAPPPPPISQN